MTHDEMKELRSYFDAKFDGVDKRFDGVDKRLDGIDGRLDGIDSTMQQEFGAITTQFVELRGYIDDAYERTNARIDLQFDGFRADMKIMREDG